MQEYTCRVLTHSYLDHLTQALMDRLNSKQKLQVQAKIISFDISSFDSRLSVAVCNHHKSFSWKRFQSSSSSCPIHFLGCLFACWKGYLDEAVWGKTYHYIILWLNYYDYLDIQVCILLSNTFGRGGRYGRSLLRVFGFSQGIRPFTTAKAKVSFITPLWSNFGLTAAFNAERST